MTTVLIYPNIRDMHILCCYSTHVTHPPSKTSTFFHDLIKSTSLGPYKVAPSRWLPTPIYSPPFVGNHRLGIVYLISVFPPHNCFVYLKGFIRTWLLRFDQLIAGFGLSYWAPTTQRQLINPNRPEQEKSLKQEKGKTRRKKKKRNDQKRLGYSETRCWRNWYKPTSFLSTQFSINSSHQPITSITPLNSTTQSLTQCIVNITPVASPSPPQHGVPAKSQPTNPSIKPTKEVAKQAHAPNAAAKAWPSTKQENCGDACSSYNLDMDVIILRG